MPGIMTIGLILIKLKLIKVISEKGKLLSLGIPLQQKMQTITPNRFQNNTLFF